MRITELGMIVFLQPVINVLLAVSMIALQFSLESNLALSLSTLIFESFLHAPNALLPIETTDLEIFKLVSPLQL